MRHWIRMTDYLTVQSKDVVGFGYDKMKDSAPQTLLVRVAATHAGIVNGNMRMYCPDMMQSGTHTWLPAKGEYKRPILIAHNDEGMVVGRVADAKYVDESYKYKTEHQIIRDSVFYGTDSRKKVDRFKTIDYIVDHLMKLPDYRGLGYIELALNLTNPDAVGKVLREEYLTVSVGFKTDSAICSICKTDWAVDDRCDHKLGEAVDGKQMFLISGNMAFEEVSFVNFPADPYAGVISKEKLADALAKTQPFFLGLPLHQQQAVLGGMHLSDSLYSRDIQIVEDNMPEKTDKLQAELAEVETPELTQEEKDALAAEAAGAPAAETTAAEPPANTDGTVTEPVTAPPAAELQLTDEVKTIAEALKLTDATTGKQVLGIIVNLDSSYRGIDDDETRSLCRGAVSQLVEVWYADSYMNYLKGRLEEKDMIVLTKAEHADLTSDEAEFTKLEGELQIARDQITKVFAAYKRSLATQIVMGKVASGAEGFKGLSTDQINEKVVELSKRHVSSLKDTVSDMLTELKFVDAAPAPATREGEKPVEVEPTVSDKTKVSETTAPTSVRDNEAEAAAKREQDLLNMRLAAMTPREREQYLWQLNFDAAKAKKTTN